MLEDEDFEEESGEAAKVGTLVHQAAQVWFRPDETWLNEMVAVQKRVADSIAELPPDQQDAAWQRMVAEATQALAEKGVVKHPRSPKLEGEDDGAYMSRLMDECFQRAIGELDGGDLPSDPNTIVEEARSLFGTIVSFYNRDVLNIVFAERRYKGDLPNKVPVHLIIDLAIDRGNGVLEIVDFKTGWVSMQTEDMYHEDQPLLNLLAIHLDPQLNAYKTKRFTYLWVRTGHETGPIELSEQRLTDYEYWLSLKWEYLKGLKDPRETVNPFCSSCGNRWKCKEFAKGFSEAMGALKPLTEEELKSKSLEDIMLQLLKIKGQEKLLDGYKKRLSEIIELTMEKHGVKVMEGKRVKARLNQMHYEKFRVEDVLALSKSKEIDPASMLTVNKGKVESIFSGDPVSLNHLHRNAFHSYSTPSVQVSEVSAKKAVEDSKAKEVK